MVSEQGPATTGRDLSLTFHIVIQGRVHDDVIYASVVCKCRFCV